MGITPDRPEKLAAAGKAEELGYEVLSDSDLLAAQAFGIAFRVDGETLERYKGFGIDLEDASGRTHHGLPVPAVFLVTGGTVQFGYVHPDYTVRLEPSILLAAAEALAGGGGGNEDGEQRGGR